MQTQMQAYRGEGQVQMEGEIGMMHLPRQETLRIAGTHWKPEEARKDSFLDPLEGAWPCQNFISDF